MVRGKKASPNKDVDIEVKVNLVMEMKLFKAGASKYSTVSSLAKAIAGVATSGTGSSQPAIAARAARSIVI